MKRDRVLIALLVFGGLSLLAMIIGMIAQLVTYGSIHTW